MTITKGGQGGAPVAPSAAADRLWTVQDVATWLGVPVATLYQWRTRHQGPRAYRVGKHLRYAPAEVRAWLEEQAPSWAE